MTREDYIKKLIEENGLTIKEFAKDINIPYSTLLTMLNSGKIGNAAVDTVIRICQGLNITIQELQDSVTQEQRIRKIVLNEHEKKLIEQYRIKEDLQKAVDILLLSPEIKDV